MHPGTNDPIWGDGLFTLDKALWDIALGNMRLYFLGGGGFSGGYWCPTRSVCGQIKSMRLCDGVRCP